MKTVNLVSGGLDSTVISVMSKKENNDIFPLFINYGQLAFKREYKTCLSLYKILKLPTPVTMDISGFGKVIKTGLTSTKLNIVDQAFTPNRNFLFLLTGSSYAYQIGAKYVTIGLLKEELSMFPDQTSLFLDKAQNAISCSLGTDIKIIAPLMNLTKGEVRKLAQKLKISGTYSCHTGFTKECGKCIACKEFN